MSSRELTEWAAYEQVAGTLGTERLDLLSGIVAATVASAMSSRRFTPQDFLPTWDRPVQQTWQEQLAIVTAINSTCGGLVSSNG